MVSGYPDLITHRPTGAEYHLAARPTPRNQIRSIALRGSTKDIGVPGFEPRTPCAQGRCATRLRYTPTMFFKCSRIF